MTSRQLYEGVLIEMRKENAPNILLEDFNYLANKAINQYINKRYNIYDINQQTTDDLRVLKATALLRPKKVDNYNGLSLVDGGMATYYVDLPSDYLHLLNCICIYNVKKTYKCYNKGDTWRAAATRLTADAYSQVLDNFWLKPTYKRPYYYIHNVNLNETVPTNPYYDSDDIEVNNNYRHGNHGTDLELPLRQQNIIIDDNYFGENIINNDPSFPRSSYSVYVYDSIITDHNGNTIDLNEKGFDVISELPDPQGLLQPFIVLNLRHDNPIFEKYVRNQPVSGIISIETDNVIKNNNYYLQYNGNKKWTLYQNGEIISSNYDDVRGGVIYLNKESSLFTSTKVTNSTGNPIDLSNIERTAQTRYGNASKVRLEIRYGTDNSVFTLDHKDNNDKGGLVYIDYIKTPQHIRLTQEELDYTEDKSQMLEFPDYVCQEILNELVHIVMENISDPRLQTHPVVSQSIANPAQAQTPEAAGQSA